MAGQLTDNPWLCLGATRWSEVGLSEEETWRITVRVLVSETGTPLFRASGNSGTEDFSAQDLLQPSFLFSLGTRPPSNPLPGIFSLPWVLCLILGALLFLVLIILVTQLLRWRAERRGGLQGELGTREGVWRPEMAQV